MYITHSMVDSETFMSFDDTLLSLPFVDHHVKLCINNGIKNTTALYNNS